MTNTNTNANATIVISSSADSLAAVPKLSHTVEAEYGSVLVHGPLCTMAHHGANAGNPCPCLGDNISKSVYPPVIGISHFDLDTLGGVMRCMRVKEYDGPGEEDMFWQIAAMVDVQGVHKLGEIQETLRDKALSGLDWGGKLYEDKAYFFDCEVEETLESLNAFWAWSETNRLFAPRDGSVLDCTDFFLEAIRVANLLIEGNDNCKETQAMYKKGQEWATAKVALNKDSLKICTEGIAVRSSDQFTNHLYETPGDICRAVVAYNEKFQSVTLSLADPIEGVSCCDIVQALWGKEAGGHAGIAGSPRGQEMTWDDCLQAAEAVNKAIN